MEIKYLSLLNNNPTYQTAGSDYVEKLKPLSLAEIVSLENAYNNGHQFPQALRELLYLAGGSCYVLDHGPTDTQEEMQNAAREWLADWNGVITRPFFVLDVYNGGGQFVFVYLDEGKDDPQIYEAFLPDITEGDWIRLLAPPTLSGFVTGRMERLLSGFNPF